MSNTIKALALMKSVRKDKALNPFHISLYTALVGLWQEQQFVHPFRVTRQQLMAASGIRSPATYHKCLKLLVSRHYIIYEPSFDPVKASLVYWPMLKYAEQVQSDKEITGEEFQRE